MAGIEFNMLSGKKCSHSNCQVREFGFGGCFLIKAESGHLEGIDEWEMLLGLGGKFINIFAIIQGPKYCYGR